MMKLGYLTLPIIAGIAFDSLFIFLILLFFYFIYLYFQINKMIFSVELQEHLVVFNYSFNKVKTITYQKEFLEVRVFELNSAFSYIQLIINNKFILDSQYISAKQFDTFLDTIENKLETQ